MEIAESAPRIRARLIARMEERLELQLAARASRDEGAPRAAEPRPLRLTGAPLD